jgi:hypothetical protein
MKKTIKNQLLEMKAEGKFHSILHCISWLFNNGTYKLSDIFKEIFGRNTGTYKLGKILDISKEIFGTDKINIDTTNITDKKSLFIINQINGCELKYDSGYPNLIFFVKNDKRLFYLDLKNDYFVCDYDKIWLFFITKYGLNNAETREVIKGILETHLKLMGYRPWSQDGLSRGLNWKDISNLKK